MITQLLTKHLNGIHCRTVLDLGPGYADFSRTAAAVTGAGHITFADCDEAVLHWQRESCDAIGLPCTMILMNIEPTALAALHERFDLIHCQEVLEHLPDPMAALRAIARLLTSYGQLVITVPTKRSERWLRFVNPSYMRNEPNGHINEFDEHRLRATIEGAGLDISVFLPAQPQYFIGHTWLFGTRMVVQGSTGMVLSRGFRAFVYGNIVKYSFRLFQLTGLAMWSHLLPRNYFVIATRHEDHC